MVNIERPKTDQWGTGVTLSINASHGITCSKSNAGVFASAASHNRAIFCRFLGKPLTRYQFIAVLAKVLTKSSINVKNFKSHSFRVGAATTLALQVETQQCHPLIR